VSAATARRLALALLALAAPLAAAAQATLPTYSVGNVPVAPIGAGVDFPVATGFQLELNGLLLTQGGYGDKNPFQYLSMVAPGAYLHYDGVENLRLSAGFQQFFYREVQDIGLPAWNEQRYFARARVQQPRGAAALYEMVQLDVRSFTDPAGVDRLVFRPRLRVGQGFNLDAVRIHSLVLYQELGLRYSSDDYAKKAFDFFRAVVGYTWTTRRGTFATVGLVGQIQLNPANTRYDFLVGPVLLFQRRFLPSKPTEEAAPAPPEIEVQ
jgi:hypothetical protein